MKIDFKWKREEESKNYPRKSEMEIPDIKIG